MKVLAVRHPGCNYFSLTSGICEKCGWFHPSLRKGYERIMEKARAYAKRIWGDNLDIERGAENSELGYAAGYEEGRAEAIQDCKDRINEMQERRKAMKWPDTYQERYRQEGLDQAWGLISELEHYLAKKRAKPLDDFAAQRMKDFKEPSTASRVVPVVGPGLGFVEPSKANNKSIQGLCDAD